MLSLDGQRVYLLTHLRDPPDFLPPEWEDLLETKGEDLVSDFGYENEETALRQLSKGTEIWYRDEAHKRVIVVPPLPGMVDGGSLREEYYHEEQQPTTGWQMENVVRGSWVVRPGPFIPLDSPWILKLPFKQYVPACGPTPSTHEVSTHAALATTKAPSFLKLPGELRNLIYRYVADDIPATTITSLLCISRQVSKEMRSILYGDPIFVAHTPSSGLQWIRWIGCNNIALLRNIRVPLFPRSSRYPLPSTSFADPVFPPFLDDSMVPFLRELSRSAKSLHRTTFYMDDRFDAFEARSVPGFKPFSTRMAELWVELINVPGLKELRIKRLGGNSFKSISACSSWTSYLEGSGNELPEETLWQYNLGLCCAQHDVDEARKTFTSLHDDYTTYVWFDWVTQCSKLKAGSGLGVPSRPSAPVAISDMV